MRFLSFSIFVFIFPIYEQYEQFNRTIYFITFWVHQYYFRRLYSFTNKLHSFQELIDYERGYMDAGDQVVAREQRKPRKNARQTLPPPPNMRLDSNDSYDPGVDLSSFLLQRMQVPIYPSIYLSIYIFIYLSIHLYIHLIYLSS